MSFISDTYIERIDPFVKILPKLLLGHLSDGFEDCGISTDIAKSALSSAICFAAIVSLSSLEVILMFNKPKAELLAELRFSTEGHLARARFLSTRDITIVRALVIYASMLPHTDASDTASAVAAASIQIAMANGLHKATVRNLHTEPDSVLHLWRHVCFLISRYQPKGLSIFEEQESPIPSPHLRDVKNFPYIRITAQETLCEIRYRLWLLPRQLAAMEPTNLEGTTSLINATRVDIDRMQMKPGGDADGSTFGKFVRRMAELFFAKLGHAVLFEDMRRRAVKEQRSLYLNDTARHEKLTDTCMDILEAAYDLSTETTWAAWRWQLEGSFPWRAMKLVFVQLCREPWSSLSERAWILAQIVVKNVSEDLRKHPTWPSLCTLMTAAKEHRDEEMVRHTSSALERSDYLQLVRDGTELFYSTVSDTDSAATSRPSHSSHVPATSSRSETAASDNQPAAIAQDKVSDLIPIGESWKWSEQIFQDFQDNFGERVGDENEAMAW